MRGAITPEIEATFGADAGLISPQVDCDPQLVEAAVFAAVRGTPLERDFQLRREACYAVRDMEARDRAFAALHHEWFARLRLAAPVLEALAERPTVSARTARCILAPAIRRQDECAELYGAAAGGPAARPYLVIRVRPDSLGDATHVLALLRHELMHIEDMLDPAFGYDPSPAQFLDDDGVPTVLRDRYRVLWDTYIDGRLVQGGRGAGVAYERRRTEFCLAFKALDPFNIAAFDKVFGTVELTHRHLLELSRNPGAILEIGAERR